MPELADVEGFRRVLDEHAVNRTIAEVEVADSQILRGFDAARLREVLRGNEFDAPRRYGKWLIVGLCGSGERRLPELMIHFGMTGSLEWAGRDEQRHKHDRVAFTLRDGQLLYRDMRKLKGLYLAADENERDTLLGELGPDACAVSAGEMAQRLTARSRQLKPALADQAVLAGLGNLLADEILWQARLNPSLRTGELTDADLMRLHKRMRTVLRRSIRAGRVPSWPSWLTGHRDSSAGECPRCGTRLRHRRIGGRAAAWCPYCQGD